MATTVLPYLTVKGAASAIDFYKKAFGAPEVMRLLDPDGRLGHAEIAIGGATVMLADEYPEYGILSPPSVGGASSGIVVYVDDVDALAQQAIAAGIKVVRAVEDQFYGDRSGKFEDPFGHVWHLATRKTEMSGEEMQRRYDEMMAAGK